MTRVVLFYQYVPISGGDSEVDKLADSIHDLAEKLQLLGRVILATEGINGNLGGSVRNVENFCKALAAFEAFKGCNIDFKFDDSDTKPFPDLVVKVKSEICSTGGTMSDDLLVQGYGGVHLSPTEFHNVIDNYWGPNAKENPDNLAIIDVRNRVEHCVGRFVSPDGREAIDSGTKIFSTWAQQFAKPKIEELKGKRVLMYCTGGVRCEKASAFLQSQGVEDVSQLSGGIHRYLEEFGSDGYFQGNNFVFDSRALQLVPGAKVLGQCSECTTPEQSITSDRVCTVCRETVLVCDHCRKKKLGVYYCPDHRYLEDVYVPFFDRYSDDELEIQILKLQEFAKTTKSRNVRRSLTKHGDLVREFINNRSLLRNGKRNRGSLQKWVHNPRCRQCGRLGPNDLLKLLGRNFKAEENLCDGKCVGFAMESYHDPKLSLAFMNSTEFKNAVKPKQSKKPKYDSTSEGFEDAEYEIITSGTDKLRAVKPYMFVYETYVKNRWIGRTILDMYSTDFGTNHAGYYEHAINLGLITVNGRRVSTSHILKDHQKIENRIHRHEPPVLYRSAQDMIVFESDQVVVLDKPPSVAVHPCGSYRHNTVLHILGAERNLRDLKLVHRLDRLTSGLLLLAKDKDLAQAFGDALMAKSASRLVDGKGPVSKLYLARVHGHFPNSEEKIRQNQKYTHNPQDHGISWHTESHDMMNVNDENPEEPGFVSVNWPIRCVSEKHGVYECASLSADANEDSKYADSRIKLLSYDPLSDTSLVKCEPITGRTHQLRLHLMLTGHPIVNDPNYGLNGNVAKANIEIQEQEELENATVVDEDTLHRLEANKGETDPAKLCQILCTACHRGMEHAFRDRHLRYRGIDLHAYRYRIELDNGTTYDFKTRMPAFAQHYTDICNKKD